MDWEEKAHDAVEIWQSSSGDLWAVQFQLVELNGRAECVGIRVSSYSDDLAATPRPLLAHTLKELPMASVLAKARRETARRELEFAAGMEQISRRQDETKRPRVIVSPEEAIAFTTLAKKEAQFLAPEGEKTTGRRTKHTRAELERVAEVYTAAHGNAGGTKSAPTKAVAETLGLTYDQAAKLVQRCRKIGLLGGTEKGIAGGVLPLADAPKEDSH